MITPEGDADLSIVDFVNNKEITETSVGIPAITAAMERLLRSAREIRRSALYGHRLRQRGHDNHEEASCLLLVQTRFPYAPKSLCSQLVASIHARGVSLQYMQEHNKKLAYLGDYRRETRRTDDGASGAVSQERHGGAQARQCLARS